MTIASCRNSYCNENLDVSPVQENARQGAGSGPALQFIDFEYSCPMQRGFDWVRQHHAST